MIDARLHAKHKLGGLDVAQVVVSTEVQLTRRCWCAGVCLVVVLTPSKPDPLGLLLPLLNSRCCCCDWST